MQNKILILISLLLCLLLTGCGTETVTKQADHRPVFVMGSDIYPPFNYLDEDGVPTGIDVDLAKEALGRMGYQVRVEQINWERKDELLKSGEIDCAWGCFSMEGRLDRYKWAGPYMVSRQMVAVLSSSDIHTLQDLEGKTLAAQSTSKPEELYTSPNHGNKLPQLGNFISLENRALAYTFMGKGYADAMAAHETAILQYMKDYDTDYRLIDEPLMTVGIGVAFDKDDDRGIAEELERTLEEMRQDGTSAKIISKYLDEPDKYLQLGQLPY